MHFGELVVLDHSAQRTVMLARTPLDAGRIQVVGTLQLRKERQELRRVMRPPAKVRVTQRIGHLSVGICLKNHRMLEHFQECVLGSGLSW